jgi:hypothetical protein
VAKTLLTDDEKFAIREYVLDLDKQKEDKLRGRIQFWIGGLGLSAAVILSGLWFAINDFVKTEVGEEIARNQYIQSIQTRLNDSIDNLINARTKHADAEALADVSLKEAQRILTESVALLDKVKGGQQDFENAQPILVAARNLSSYSAKLATDLSHDPKFVTSVAQSATVPSGAVIAFDSPIGCPAGWRAYDLASGRFLIGAGKPTDLSLTSYAYRTIGGAEKIQLTQPQLPPFTITYPVFRSNEFSLQNSGYPGYRFIGQAAREAASGASGILTSEQSDPVGKGQYIDIRPPFVAMLFCVKA